MASFLDLEGRQSIILDGQGEVTVWSVPKEEVPKLRNDDRIACAGAKMENVADAGNMGWQITSNTKDKPVTGDLYIGDRVVLSVYHFPFDLVISMWAAVFFYLTSPIIIRIGTRET